MQANLSQTSRASAVSLGANHGYRFDGDTAFLNAELAIDSPEALAAERWALQLWACEAPYQGGPLRGIKVAEAALDTVTARLEANALAQLPPAQRDYAMVLVLAADGQVHDFSNYPTRQRFTGPHLSGSVGYRFEGEEVVLSASVTNPRVSTNLSGTLALELWALSERYDGGALAGTQLAQAELGSVSGACSREGLELRAARRAVAAGDWNLSLVLREWTGAGYQTRDFCNFPATYRVEPTVRALRATSVVDEAPAPRSEPNVVTLRAVPSVPKSEPAVECKPAPVAKSEPVELKVVPAAPRSEPAQPPLAVKALPRLSISTASVEELARVKGLNLKLAQAIVRARPFGSVDDLTRIRGIGDKMVQKLRAQLTL